MLAWVRNAATKCFRVINNVEKVLAIELLSAAQALDFRRPMKSSETLEKLHTEFREVVSFNQEDRVLHDDMMKAVEFVRMWNA
jgi:histidine ammonia-lyase